MVFRSPEMNQTFDSISEDSKIHHTVRANLALFLGTCFERPGQRRTNFSQVFPIVGETVARNSTINAWATIGATPKGPPLRNI